MISFGLQKIVELKMAWPPTASEFAGLCKPTAEDLGLPPLDEALRNVFRFRRDKSVRLDPFTFTLYRELCSSFFQLDRLSEDKYHRKTKYQYDRLVRHALNGGKLHVQPEFIDQRENQSSGKILDREFVRAGLQAAKQQILRSETTNEPSANSKTRTNHQANS